MINDVNILRMKSWNKDMGKIPRMVQVDESKYKEFWSFWGLERARQDLDGRKRLRYHLGHVLFAKQLYALNNRGNHTKVVLMDYEDADETQAHWNEDDKDKTKSFLNIFLGETIAVKHIQDYIDSVKQSEWRPLYDKIKDQIEDLTKPIQNAYDDFVQNQHALYYLEKYRDLRIGDLQYVPPCLADIYNSSSVVDIVPSHIFFASLFSLHRNTKSDSHFVKNFWVKEGFPFLACIQKLEKRKICIIEGKRSAYIWLFIDYLRIMYDHHNGGELDLPEVGYLDSLPSLHGASFMQLDEPSEALFIDSFSTEMKKKLLHMPKALREEYTLRVFGGESYDPEQNTNEWINWAVGRCECDRNKINKLRGHYKRNEIWDALATLIGSVFAWLKPVIHLIRIIWGFIRGK